MPNQLNRTGHSYLVGKRLEVRLLKGYLLLYYTAFLGLFFIPATIMVVDYVHIILHMKRSRVGVGVTTNTARFKGLKHVTLTAFFASTIIVVCWLPDQLYYALSVVELTQLVSPAHSALHLLAFPHSCINPFIYSFSNHEYRNCLKEIFYVWCRESR